MANVWNIQHDGNDPVTSVDHEAPVEALRIFPGDALLATAGGENIKIWNIAVGGDLLQVLQNHHKSVSITYCRIAIIAIDVKIVK